jgi:hypothetical protein
MSVSLLTDILNFENIPSFLERIENYYIFEVFAKYFLLYDEKLIHRVKNVYLYKEIPKYITEKLRLSSIDKGIDLIIETFDNTYISVQCKYSNNVNKKIPWFQLSSFEAITMRNNNFEFGILFSNTLKPCEEITKNDKIVFYMNEQIIESKTFFPLLKRELIKNTENILLKQNKNFVLNDAKSDKIQNNNENENNLQQIEKKENDDLLLIINKLVKNGNICIDKLKDIIDFLKEDNEIKTENENFYKVFISKLRKNKLGFREIKEFENFVFLSSKGESYISVDNLHKLYIIWCIHDKNGDELIDKKIFSKRIRKILNVKKLTKAYLLKSAEDLKNNGVTRINSFNIKYFN